MLPSGHGGTPLISKRKKEAIAAFEQAACLYDTAAVVQKTIGCHLAEWIRRLDLPAHPTVLEIGCGTGLFTRAVLDRLEPTLWLATDVSPAMATCCRDHFGPDQRFLFACMDGEMPAVASGFDLVCANLAMQWFDDLAGALERLAWLTRSGGWLAFTTLAAGTFVEWVEIHRRLGVTAGTPIYPDLATLNRQLPPGGKGTVAGEVIRHAYPDARAFVATLKTIGAHTSERRPLAPGTFRQVLRAFGAGATVSYHVAYGLWHRLGTGQEEI